jgi:hypothetical protein
MHESVSTIAGGFFVILKPTNGGYGREGYPILPVI